MPKDFHQDRGSIESFQRWITVKFTGLAKQPSSNKNALQALLLGIGLFLRDLEFACFANQEETPIPEYLAQSCMLPDDVDSITKNLKLVYEFLEDDLGYVLLHNRVGQKLINCQVRCPALHLRSRRDKPKRKPPKAP